MTWALLTKRKMSVFQDCPQRQGGGEAAEGDGSAEDDRTRLPEDPLVVGRSQGLPGQAREERGGGLTATRVTRARKSKIGHRHFEPNLARHTLLLQLTICLQMWPNSAGFFFLLLLLLREKNIKNLVDKSVRLTRTDPDRPNDFLMPSVVATFASTILAYKL